MAKREGYGYLLCFNDGHYFAYINENTDQAIQFTGEHHGSYTLSELDCDYEIFENQPDNDMIKEFIENGSVSVRPKQSKEQTCSTCGTTLGIPGGMGDSGLCGPCCTGEASTLDEMGESW